jgi:hypothetical protein
MMDVAEAEADAPKSHFEQDVARHIAQRDAEHEVSRKAIAQEMSVACAMHARLRVPVIASLRAMTT